MHAIQTTPGYIIGSRAYGDAGKILSIFTRDFGLVYATAQGIRLEKSKLRYYIQDYSFGVYSLVRGREYWRVTSANSTKELFYGLQLGTSELIARIAFLLKRLLHGEEAHPELFDCVFECAKFLGQENSNEVMQTLESLVVARILYALGYIGKIEEVLDTTGLAGQMRSKEISVELLRSIAVNRALLNQHINKALKESML